MGKLWRLELPAERRVRGCDKLSLRARRPNNVGSLRCLATVGGLHGRASMRGLFLGAKEPSKVAAEACDFFVSFLLGTLDSLPPAKLGDSLGNLFSYFYRDLLISWHS